MPRVDARSTATLRPPGSATGDTGAPGCRCGSPDVLRVSTLRLDRRRGRCAARPGCVHLLARRLVRAIAGRSGRHREPAAAGSRPRPADHGAARGRTGRRHACRAARCRDRLDRRAAAGGGAPSRRFHDRMRRRCGRGERCGIPAPRERVDRRVRGRDPDDGSLVRAGRAARGRDAAAQRDVRSLRGRRPAAALPGARPGGAGRLRRHRPRQRHRRSRLLRRRPRLGELPVVAGARRELRPRLAGDVQRPLARRADADRRVRERLAGRAPAVATSRSRSGPTGWR